MHLPLIRPLSPETIRLLHRIHRSSRHHQVRQRAQFLILYNQGKSLSQLIPIFSVTRKTLYNWINAWESKGLLGLYNQPGQGRKRTFTPDQEQQIYQWVQASPTQLNQVLAKIKEEWNIKTSKVTIKRILKRLNMSWHRFRRVCAGKPHPQDYQKKESELDELKQQDDADTIELYYMDESGFCLIPCIPYGWQPLGQYLGLLSQMSERLNVLGFLRRNGDLESYVSKQTINSDVVIMCIEQYFLEREKPVFIVMDNASIHTSHAIADKEVAWEKEGIHLFWLPTYSPQLNLIEILWKFMKYYWIEIDAYRCWNSLVKYVERVLRQFGQEYVINFA